MREDLVASFRDADYARTTAHVPLGTPAAERYVIGARLADREGARGLFPEPAADPPFAWVVGDRADVWLDVVHPAPRELQLRLSAVGDGPRSVTVLWGGRELGRASLPADGSEPRLSFDVPEGWQRVGRNLLSLRFDRTTVRRLRDDRPAVPVAARLRHVRLVALDGRAPPRPFVPGPVTVEDAAGARRVVRLPPACLASLALRVPDADGALLRWTVRVAEVPLEMWLEDDEGRREPLPGGRPGGTPMMVEHDLGPWRGRPLRLWLRTGPQGAGRVEIGPCLVMAAPDAAEAADGAAAPSAPAGGGTAGVPSFLVVVFDGLRRDHVSALGHRGWTTAHLDELIAGGGKAAVAVAPSTSSRASLAGLLTGLSPGELGALGRADDDAPVPALGERAPLLAATLQSAGWRTALFAGRPDSVPSGARRGFDHVAPDTDAGAARVDGHRLAEDFGAWLRERPDAPFLAVVAPSEPGPPLRAFPQATPAPVAPYDGPVTADLAWAAAYERGDLPLDGTDVAHLRELYAAAVGEADALLGRLLVALRWSDREADTVVVVTSTRGLALLEHGRVGAAAGATPELLDVPLVVRRAGAEVFELRGTVTLADVPPTLLRMAGLTVPAAMDGRDLSAAGPPGRGVVSRAAGARAPVAWTSDGWRLVFDPETGARTLHDLASDDPGRDLSGRRPVLAALLEQDLQGALVEAVGSDPAQTALRRLRRRP